MPYKDKEKAAAYNRDYQRAYMRAYRASHLEELKEKARKNRAANRDKIIARRRSYYAANKEKICAARRNTYDITKKEKRREYRKKEYEKNPNVEIERNRRRREALAGRPRPDCCEVCGRDDRPITFDHSHAKQHFRGWLCSNCNVALGMVHDDPNVLLKLAAYLKRTRKNASHQLALRSI